MLKLKIKSDTNKIFLISKGQSILVVIFILLVSLFVFNSVSASILSQIKINKDFNLEIESPSSNNLFQTLGTNLTGTFNRVKFYLGARPENDNISIYIYKFSDNSYSSGSSQGYSTDFCGGTESTAVSSTIRYLKSCINDTPYTFASSSWYAIQFGQSDEIISGTDYNSYSNGTIMTGSAGSGGWPQYSFEDEDLFFIFDYGDRKSVV